MRARSIGFHRYKCHFGRARHLPHKRFVFVGIYGQQCPIVRSPIISCLPLFQHPLAHQPSRPHLRDSCVITSEHHFATIADNFPTRLVRYTTRDGCDRRATSTFGIVGFLLSIVAFIFSRASWASRRARKDRNLL